MLELELALAPFVETRLGRLSAADKARYRRLLERDDWDIFDWVQGRSEPIDPDLAVIVAQIRSARGRPGARR
jgi:antitoxin CptB